MRKNTTLTVLGLAAATSVLLAGCSSDTTADATASTSPSTATEVAALNVSDILESVRTASACEDWTGGKVAGEGVVAGWEYKCDADEDGEWDSVLAIYSTDEDRDSDLAAYESTYSDSAVAVGANFLFLTTDQAQLDGVTSLGLGTVERELAA